jgi:hypothetical protein
MEWMSRRVVGSRKSEVGSKPRASWAAVLFALASLIVDVSGWIKSDLKPLIEATRQNSETLQRIERRLEDHERRIAELERQRK